MLDKILSFIADRLSSLINQIAYYNVKNLLPYPFYHKTITINGITWSDNGDGTVTANGTATSRSTFYLRVTADAWLVPAGKYRMTGCPDGGGWTTGNMKYRAWANYRKNGGDTGYGSDVGNGLDFTVTGTEEAIGVGLQIESGQTVNNLIFRPMIRLINNGDDTWQPFAKSNVELTELVEKSTKNYTTSELSSNLAAVTATVRRTGDTGILNLYITNGASALESGATMTFKLPDLPTLYSASKGVAYTGKTVFVINIGTDNLVTIRMIGDPIRAGLNVGGMYIPIIFA